MAEFFMQCQHCALLLTKYLGFSFSSCSCCEGRHGTGRSCGGDGGEGAVEQGQAVVGPWVLPAPPCDPPAPFWGQQQQQDRHELAGFLLRVVEQ